MFEKLRVIIDVQTANARKALSDFGASIRSADGVAGKFKAGWASASESIRANAASIAVTAGAALVAFGVKALAAFEKSSKAALDFGKATGLTTEAASRWVAVADDFGVAAGALQTAMGKAAKQGLDFRDVLDQINAAAPGDRARVAAELLGRSWQSVAPLFGKTRAEYEKMLGAVEDGQVITEAEAKKAERMRLAQDALSDALKEVTLAVGEQVAELAPYVEYLAKAVSLMNELADVTPPTAEDVGSLGDKIREQAKAARESGDAMKYLTEQGYSTDTASRILKDTLDAVGEAASEAGPNVEDLMDAFSEAAGAAGAVNDLSDSFGILLGQLDTRDAIDNVIDAFDDLDTAWAEAAEAQAAGSEDADRKTREAAASVRDLQRDVIAYGDTVDGLPPERITEILALINEGSVDEARLLFAELTAGETKTITVFTKFEGNLGGTPVEGPKGTPIKVKGKRAAGGPVTSGGAYLVGELGPEIVNIPGGSNVTPNSALGGGVTNVSIAVNVGPGADPVSVGRATADALAAYYRNGGSRP